MIDYKTEAELIKILKLFNIPELIYKGKLDAGPDEELYFFEDKNKNKYGLWSRDYMSELKYEANGLKNNYNINLEEWIKTANGEDIVYRDGDCFALFKMVSSIWIYKLKISVYAYLLLSLVRVQEDCSPWAPPRQTKK